MIVVADTSPLNYLILIGEADLLYKLYGRVLIPQAVLSELQHSGTPSAVIEWIKNRPQWLEVRHIIIPSEAKTEELDLGESEAIALAEEYKPDVLLLMDEETGRLVAARRNLRSTGTLGVLHDAAARGLVDVKAAIESLKNTNFRAADKLFDWLLANDRRREES